MSIEERILTTIANSLNFEREEIYPKAHLLDDLIIDSLDYVNILVDLENEFGIQFDAIRFETVQNIIDYIKEKTK